MLTRSKALNCTYHSDQAEWALLGILNQNPRYPVWWKWNCTWKFI